MTMLLSDRHEVDQYAGVVHLLSARMLVSAVSFPSVAHRLSSLSMGPQFVKDGSAS